MHRSAVYRAVTALGWWVSALALASTSTSAKANDGTSFAEDFAVWQQRDSYIQTIGWKLLAGNTPYCRTTQMAIGMLIQDAGAYSNPSKVRAFLGLNSDFFVQAVVDKTPAAQAGVQVGEGLSAVDRHILDRLPLASKRPWQRLQTVNDLITATLALDGKVSFIRLVNGAEQKTEITGTRICSSYFELIANSTGASANGMRVAVGKEFPGFTYPEAEFAAALAHELAHNFLDHTAWLKAKGRTREAIRQTEREADRLMPWLLANAGYDPAAAVLFMERWGPRHDGDLFRKGTHDRWKDRAEQIRTELPLIQQSIGAHSVADWRQDFVQQFPRTLPAQ